MHQPPTVSSIVISLMIILPVITFWLWMFQDMMNNDNLPSESKNNWTLAFLFGNVFAAAFYYATQIEQVENDRDAAKRKKVRRDLAILAGGSLAFLAAAIVISFIHR